MGSTSVSPERRQAVLDAGRRFGVRAAVDEAVALELAQRLGEDLAGDAADEVDELAVAPRAAAEREHDDRPLVGDDLDRQPGRAVREEDVAREVTRGTKVLSGTCRVPGLGSMELPESCHRLFERPFNVHGADGSAGPALSGGAAVPAGQPGLADAVIVRITADRVTGIGPWAS
jgi:hypothetical protein